MWNALLISLSISTQQALSIDSQISQASENKARSSSMADSVGKVYLQEISPRLTPELREWVSREMNNMEAAGLAILICGGDINMAVQRWGKDKQFFEVLPKFKEVADATLCKGYLPGTGWAEQRRQDVGQWWRGLQKSLPGQIRWIFPE